jgi:TolC family type I secretion outer membrane protein
MISIRTPCRYLSTALILLGVAGLATMLGGGVAAAQGTAQTLNDALAGAYSSNPTLSAARAALRGVNEGVPQALSNWRPRVTLNGSAGAQYTDQTTSATNSDGSSLPTEATVEVVQPLYRGGRTLAGTEAAENDVLAERSNLVSVEQQVLFNAVSAFMDVWRDRAIVDLNQNNERVIRRQLEATQDRFSVGEVTRTDVAQAETRLATATAQRTAAEGSLAANRAVFEEVIGFQPQNLVVPREIPGLPNGKDEVVAQAVAGNPDVLSASFAEKASRYRVRETAGELLPNLQLRATASRRDDSTQRDTSAEQAEILAEVSIPLYQQGSVSSRVRQAKQVSSQRRVQIEERRRNTQQQAVSAWENLVSARAQIVSFQAGVRSAEIALEGVRQENLVGARTILDILDAEQELLNAQVNLVGAQRDEVVASFQILSVMGRLTAAELNLPIEIYDPQADYSRVRDKWFGLSAPNAD